MNDEPYSNREIREFFADVKESQAKILEQVIKTNGRVGKLETWRGFITGGLAVISILLIPILIKFFEI